MPIAYSAVFVAFLQIYATRPFVARAQAKTAEGFDNRLPRDQQTHLDDFGKRALAAHNNSFEAFAPFAASVIIAVSTSYRTRAPLIDGLAMAFVVLRALYIALYLGDVPGARSVVWTLGLACVIGLFVVSYFG